jgi:hypothetical protein
MQVLDKLGGKVGWLAKKLGFMKDETAELDTEAAKNNPYATGAGGREYSPSGGLVNAGASPVIEAAPPVGRPDILPAPVVNASPAAIALAPPVMLPATEVNAGSAPPVAPLAPQRYAPVMRGASSAYTDNSVTHNKYDVVIPAGMSREETLQLLNESAGTARTRATCAGA